VAILRQLDALLHDRDEDGERLRAVHRR